MEIKIELGADIRYESPVLRVELYRSLDALLNPIEHPEDCFNCVSLIDLKDTSKHDNACSLIKTIQVSVNALLRMAEDKKEKNL
jgi:hypothetical protein